MKIGECPELTENNEEMEVLEWIKANRHGKRKDGKENTQLELCRVILTVRLLITWIFVPNEVITFT